MTLTYGATGTSGNVNFDPLTSLFTVNSEGDYLVSYGLSCAADSHLLSYFASGNATAWIAAERTQPGPIVSEIGGVPLAVTDSVVNNAGPSQLLSGFGQLEVHLTAGDTVGLKLFVNGGTGATGGALTLDPSQITSPSLETINNGGTLSLLLIP